MTALIEHITGWMVELIGATGYFGVFVLMTVESALIPLPSEVTMPFAGFLVSEQRLAFWGVVLAGGLGNLVGSLVAYFLGWRLGEPMLRVFIRSHGRWVLMSEHDYDLAERWLRERGELIVFASRMLPVIRTFISLPAGVAHMNLTRFCIYSLVGSLIWSALLTQLGVKLGENWPTLSDIWHRFDAVIVAVLLALVALYVWHKRELLGGHQLK